MLGRNKIVDEINVMKLWYFSMSHMMRHLSGRYESFFIHISCNQINKTDNYWFLNI